MVFAWVGRYLSEVRAFVGVVGGDYPDVAVGRAVWVRGRAVAVECYLLAIRRPGWIIIIEIARCNLCQRFAGNVENIKVLAAAIQVADFIFFKAVAVHDDGAGLVIFFLCLAVGVVGVTFLFSFGLIFFVERRILQYQQDTFAVWRPDEVVYILNGFC